MGQDSCVLSFLSSNGSISSEHEALIDSRIGNNKVEFVSIKAYVPESGSVSRNRILTEFRVQEVKKLMLNKGIPFNHLSTRIVLEETDLNWNKVIVEFNFGAKIGEKVLKKTSVVQISEVDFVVKNEPKEVVEKKEKKEDPKVAVEKNEILKVDNFKKNEIISLPNLLFEPGTHFLLPGSEKVLLELLNVMQAKPKLRIELQGHICCRLGGLDGYDPTTGRENLSEMRSKVVYLFLVSRGIEKYRMTYKGFGSSRKLYPDLNSVSAQTLNRRVEVLVTATE